jgi:hypothetical protein
MGAAEGTDTAASGSASRAPDELRDALPSSGAAPSTSPAGPAVSVLRSHVQIVWDVCARLAEERGRHPGMPAAMPAAAPPADDPARS